MLRLIFRVTQPKNNHMILAVQANQIDKSDRPSVSDTVYYLLLVSDRENFDCEIRKQLARMQNVPYDVASHKLVISG